MRQKLKILYTIPNFHTAGSGKVLYDLARCLNPDYFEVSIACKHGKGEFFKHVENLGIPIYFIDTTVPLRPYYSLLFRIGAFKDFVKKHQFDIVHSWHWSSDWSEVLSVRGGGANFVYTKKAMSWGNIHWKIRSYLSNFIITINDEMQHYFPYKNQQQLIPLGIDVDFFSPKHFQKVKGEVFNIVTVANLVPVKGIEVLIRALKLLSGYPVSLTIIGDDQVAYAQKLKNLVKNLQIERIVHFKGSQIDVRPYLIQADLYVIPTLDEGRKEGMPMALVEAMSMEIPVLGSDISGIRYVLKNFPNLLFEASNVSSLTDKILSVYHMSTEERKKLGSSLRDYCLSNFSMHQFIKAHETLYLDLNTKRNSWLL